MDSRMEHLPVRAILIKEVLIKDQIKSSECASAQITPKLTDMGMKKQNALKLITLGENGVILPVQVNAVMLNNLQSIQETHGHMKLVITLENNSFFAGKAG